MGNELQVAVIGPAGNAGQELTRMLFQHPRLRPPLLLAPANDGAGSMSELKLDSGTVHPFSWSIIHRQGVDLLFVAASQTAARMLIPEAAAHGLRVIDLSTAARGRSKDLQGALGKAVQEMNSIYGWSQTEGLA